jgi:hypothetical protein
MQIVTSLNTRVLVTTSHFDSFLTSSSTFLSYGKQIYKMTTKFVPVRAHVRHLSNKRPPKNQTVMSVQHYGRANVWGGSHISTNEPRVPKLRIVIIHMQFFFILAQQPPVGQGLLIHKVSRSHITTHHSR